MQPSARPSEPASARPEGAPPRGWHPGPTIGGLALVVVGLLMLVERLGWADIDVWATIGQLWPLVIVAMGGLLLRQRRWVEGTGAVLLGLLLLGGTTGLGPEVGPELIGPLVVVGIGLAILSAGSRRTRGDTGSMAMFSGLERTIDPTAGEVETVTALFGGMEVRLEPGEPAPGASLSAMALFGGVEVYVPDDLPVRVRRRALFGGVEVKVPEARHGDPAYEIDANAIFGGVEVVRR